MLLMFGPVVTVKFTPLLDTPLMFTTTGPELAPIGTGAVMTVSAQLLVLATVPLKDTVLVRVPTVGPKFAPFMVTTVPTGPDVGFRLLMTGGGTTVNGAPLLATPPTVTTTFPVVAPAGTGTSILVALQAEGAASVPLKVTVLVPCVAPKFVPVMVTVDPIGPCGMLSVEMLGAVLITVNVTPLLTIPPTVTKTFPVVAPVGTGMEMLVAVQPVAVPAAVPLNVTVLVP